MKIPVLPYLVFVLLISCSKTENKVNLNYCIQKNDFFTLKRSNIVSFELDTITSPSINYLKYFNINDSLFYTFLNHYTNSIYCYEYNSKEHYKTLKLSSSTSLSGYEIISWDKVLAYHYKSFNLTLQDGKGKIIKRFVIPEKGQQNGFFSLPSTHAPLISYKGYYYLGGGHRTIKKADDSSHCVAKIDSTLSKVDFLYHFPEIYKKFFFGGSHYRTGVSYTYNSDDDIFVFNFPASHKLFSTKNFKNEKEYCAGSKFIEFIPDYGNRGDDETFQYVSENGYYHSILYDKYNKVYYRVCLLPAEKNKKYSRDLSVIILNKDFKVVGEKLFKNNIDFSLGRISAINVSPDGLLFQQKNDSSNEDNINFIAYKLIEI